MHNATFPCGEGSLVPWSFPNIKAGPLPAVHDCLFSILSISRVHHLTTRRAVMEVYLRGLELY